jgi:hypothetical protein
VTLSVRRALMPVETSALLRAIVAPRVEKAVPGRAIRLAERASPRWK